MQPETGQVQQVHDEIVTEARRIVAEETACKWTLGRLAHDWIVAAPGRTDAQFGDLVGLERDQVAQRRLVWERFGGCYPGNTLLSWSHYREAVSWPDAEECLAWADENAASRREMIAWREMQQTPEPTVRDCRTVGTPAEADEPQIQEPARVRSARPDPEPETGDPPAQGRTRARPSERPDIPDVRWIDQFAAGLAHVLESLSPSGADQRRAAAEALRAKADELDPPEEATGSGDVVAVSDVVAAWNRLAVLPKCAAVTAKRKAAVRQRLRDPFWRENWREALHRIPDSPFLTGTNDRNWVATFDFFLRPDTVVRILEGVYDGGGSRTDNAFREVFGDDWYG